MKLSLSHPPYADAPVVVLISGLGGSGSFWLPQLAGPEQEDPVVWFEQGGDWLFYTFLAAQERFGVDLGGRRVL